MTMRISRYAVVVAIMSMTFATTLAAVECYPEVKLLPDMQSKGYTLNASVKADKMELLAYASDSEQKWLLLARPESGMVNGAAPDEIMLCPLDAGEGDVDAMKQSPYFQKFFVPAAAKPAE